MAGPGKTTPKDSATEKAPDSERIARRIARAGVCSRRDAEKLIAARRVAVNGMVIESPALNVGPKDTITIDGTDLPTAEPVRLWRLHKKKGRITAARDPQGRATVFDDLPKDMPRVITVGRLDFNTEGLLLLTNDGALARTLELPATGWVRRYRVRVHGRVDESALAGLAKGVTLDGVRYGPVEAQLERRTGANAWLRVGLTEGKNREVRKLLNSLGLEVTRLIRISFGPFQLGKMPPGDCAEVSAQQLHQQLGGLLPKSAALPPVAKQGQAKARPRLKAKPAAKPRKVIAKPSPQRGAKQSAPRGAKQSAQRDATQGTPRGAKHESRPAAKTGAKHESKPGAKPRGKSGSKSPTKPGAKQPAKPRGKPPSKPGAGGARHAPHRRSP